MADRLNKSGMSLSERFVNEIPANQSAIDKMWDDTFAGAADNINRHHNSIWESLFCDVKWFLPLGWMMALLRRYPNNPKILTIIRCLPGYKSRYKEFHRRIAQEEQAASRFAISPETDKLRGSLNNYGRRNGS